MEDSRAWSGSNPCSVRIICELMGSVIFRKSHVHTFVLYVTVWSKLSTAKGRANCAVITANPSHPAATNTACNQLLNFPIMLHCWKLSFINPKEVYKLKLAIRALFRNSRTWSWWNACSDGLCVHQWGWIMRDALIGNPVLSNHFTAFFKCI